MCILLAKRNFGSGSSREHAVWALSDYRIRCVIATSFADIFFNNSFKNGMLPIVLPVETIEQLFAHCSTGRTELTVDLEKQVITGEGGVEIAFEVDGFRRHCLLNGLDDIALTLEHQDKITAFEEARSEDADGRNDALNRSRCTGQAGATCTWICCLGAVRTDPAVNSRPHQPTAPHDACRRSEDRHARYSIDGS